MNAESQQTRLLKNPQITELFSSSLKKIKQNSFLNSTKKLKILELVNITLEELSSINLLKDYKKFEEPTYSVTQIDLILSRNISDYFYKVSCRICDI